MDKKLNPQNKANLAVMPGVAVIIQTDDRRAVVLTPALAEELARNILAIPEPVGLPTDPNPAHGGLVQ